MRTDLLCIDDPLKRLELTKMTKIRVICKGTSSFGPLTFNCRVQNVIMSFVDYRIDIN